MDYFAGLDISMDETHVCVVDRDGAVVYQGVDNWLMAPISGGGPDQVRPGRRVVTS
jgi:hypothetical protein